MSCPRPGKPCNEYSCGRSNRGYCQSDRRKVTVTIELPDNCAECPMESLSMCQLYGRVLPGMAFCEKPKWCPLMKEVNG